MAQNIWYNGQYLIRNDWEALIAQGKLKGYIIANVFGIIDAIDSADGELDVWSNGSNLTYLTDGETHSIVSADAGDTQSYSISGLVDDGGVWTLATEAGVLTGTTPVVLSNNWVRIHRIALIGATTLGLITLTADSAATTQARVEVGCAVSQQSFYTIPSGHTGYVASGFFSLGREIGGSATKVGTVALRARLFGGQFAGVFEVPLNSAGTSCVTVQITKTELIPAKTDLKITADSESNGTRVNGRLDLMLIEDENFDDVA